MAHFLKSILAEMAVVTALGLLAGPAMADVKIYPAASCNFATPAFAGRMSVYNPSFTLSTGVTCPLFREHPTAKPISIVVSVIDNSSLQSGNGAVECFALAVNRFGTRTSQGVVVKTTGTNSAGSLLTLPIPAVQFANGAYSVVCTVPRRSTGDDSSAIATIRVTEPDPAP